MIKHWIVFYFILTIFIVFLEGRLFEVGTTAFGLLSLLSLALACLFIYWWLIVQSLYIR